MTLTELLNQIEELVDALVSDDEYMEWLAGRNPAKVEEICNQGERVFEVIRNIRALEAANDQA